MNDAPTSTDWTCPACGHVAVGEILDHPPEDGCLVNCDGCNRLFRVRVDPLDGIGPRGRSWQERLTSDLVTAWVPQYIRHGVPYTLTELDTIKGLKELGMTFDRYLDLFNQWIEDGGWEVGPLADFLAWIKEQERGEADGTYRPRELTPN